MVPSKNIIYLRLTRQMSPLSLSLPLLVPTAAACNSINRLDGYDDFTDGMTNSIYLPSIYTPFLPTVFPFLSFPSFLLRLSAWLSHSLTT